MTSDEAAQLKEYMTAVVEEGTGSVLKGRSYTAAGKTGTAEYSMSDGEKTHSWFMGFTNVDNPELVISVITEGSKRSSINIKCYKRCRQNFSVIYMSAKAGKRKN